MGVFWKFCSLLSICKIFRAIKVQSLTGRDSFASNFLESGMYWPLSKKIFALAGGNVHFYSSVWLAICYSTPKKVCEGLIYLFYLWVKYVGNYQHDLRKNAASLLCTMEPTWLEKCQNICNENFTFCEQKWLRISDQVHVFDWNISKFPIFW